MGYRSYKIPTNKAPLRTVTGRGNDPKTLRPRFLAQDRGPFKGVIGEGLGFRLGLYGEYVGYIGPK